MYVICETIIFLLVLDSINAEDAEGSGDESSVLSSNQKENYYLDIDKCYECNGGMKSSTLEKVDNYGCVNGTDNEPVSKFN